MTMTSEIDEAIAAIEKCAEKSRTVRLSPHRWGQVLRILKFYRLKEDELMRDPAWSWRQDHPASPYYIKDRPEILRHFARYYKDKPEQCIEPPAEVYHDGSGYYIERKER